MNRGRFRCGIGGVKTSYMRSASTAEGSTGLEVTSTRLLDGLTLTSEHRIAVRRFLRHHLEFVPVLCDLAIVITRVDDVDDQRRNVAAVLVVGLLCLAGIGYVSSSAAIVFDSHSVYRFHIF